MHGLHPFYIQVVVFLLAGTAGATVARFFKLPLITGYMAAGLFLAPFMGHGGEEEFVEAAQQITFSVLLFVTGLELNWSKLTQQLRSGFLLSALILVGSAVIGFSFAWLIGANLFTGAFIALALSITSSVAVIKQLTDSHDAASLHGQLTTSILLVQDIAAIIALVVLSGFMLEHHLSAGEAAIVLIIKGIAVVTLFWGASKTIIPIIFDWFGRSTELLLLGSLTWCFIICLAFVRFNLPLEAGALLAGLCLAPLPYSFDIISRLRTFRDFFLILLFFSLGLTIVTPQPSYAALTVLLFFVVILARPAASFLALSVTGYRSRSAFFTAISQTQLSEFSLIFTSFGIAAGAINTQLASAISTVTIASMLFGTVLFQVRKPIYQHLAPFLRRFERGRHLHRHIIFGETEPSNLEGHVILFGYHRMGYHILKEIQARGHQALVVDFNPEVVHQLRQNAIAAIYGDVEDEAIYEASNLAKASMVVSTIPHREECESLIANSRLLNPEVAIIVTARRAEDALHYYKLGADYVILPHLIGGEQIGELIRKHRTGSLKPFAKKRAEELVNLKKNQSNALYFD